MAGQNNLADFLIYRISIPLASRVKEESIQDNQRAFIKLIQKTTSAPQMLKLRVGLDSGAGVSKGALSSSLPMMCSTLLERKALRQAASTRA
ncbi:hypothetical protein DFAR_2210049 [Desulfarculales bacterium]